MAAERRYREAQRTGRGYAEALREYQAAERAALALTRHITATGEARAYRPPRLAYLWCVEIDRCALDARDFGVHYSPIDDAFSGADTGRRQMAQGNVVVQGVEMTMAAAECVREAAVDVAADLRALRAGRRTSKSLLAECLDGADEDREQGWRDYVAALESMPEPVRLAVTDIKASESGRVVTLTFTRAPEPDEEMDAREWARIKAEFTALARECIERTGKSVEVYGSAPDCQDWMLAEVQP